MTSPTEYRGADNKYEVQVKSVPLLKIFSETICTPFDTSLLKFTKRGIYYGDNTHSVQVVPKKQTKQIGLFSLHTFKCFNTRTYRYIRANMYIMSLYYKTTSKCLFLKLL